MSDASEQSADHHYVGVRLTSFTILRLFSEFNYFIPFNSQERVTAIIAPNGSGKTLCLRMIDALFSSRWSLYDVIDFESATFKFSNEVQIVIDKKTQYDLSGGDDDDVVGKATIIITTPWDAEPVLWRPVSHKKSISVSLERHIHFITRVGSDRWSDDRTGEIYSLQQVMESFGDMLPASQRVGQFQKVPNALRQIIDGIHCRLIETQRLLILNDPLEDRYVRRSTPSQLAISKKAESLKETISREINVYATLSQSLDRSFPRRVIEAQDGTYPPEGLKIVLDELDTRRQKLMDSGILDSEDNAAVALPNGPIRDEIARVLGVYAHDTKRKLDTLSSLLSKIVLFKELIDTRFVDKDVRINRESGIDVFFHGKKVSLSQLSSGEQHQLVLFFELLFEIRLNSLILIDEPELSLHVAWQKKFISDLMRIIQLNQFDVVLATHSPQLIGPWHDLVVELGDVYEGVKESDQDHIAWMRGAVRPNGEKDDDSVLEDNEEDYVSLSVPSSTGTHFE